MAASVTEWIDDPRVPGHQVGWATVPALEYVRPVQRLAVRSPKKNGQWGVSMLVSASDPRQRDRTERAALRPGQPSCGCAA